MIHGVCLQINADDLLFFELLCKPAEFGTGDDIQVTVSAASSHFFLDPSERFA
jgi:hypothetical protein